MLSERLRELLGSRNISKEKFAEMCDLPVETIRNIYYGKTTDPKISTVMQIADALNISVNCLMGKCAHTTEEKVLLTHYRMCGHHGRSLIQLTAKYEALTAKEERESTDRHKIPCLLPQGDVRKGIVYDACETEEIYTSTLNAYVGIKMPNNDLAPFYCKGDVILLANQFPKNNNYAVFYRNGRAYIRQYLEEDGQYRLKCLHNMGEDMIMKRMDEIDYIGTCCGVIRS